jgi:hypothetical protein
MKTIKYYLPVLRCGVPEREFRGVATSSDAKCEHIRRLMQYSSWADAHGSE